MVINLFNAGDATTFAEALVRLEKIGIGHELAYEIRLFTDENMLQSGEAFKDLLDPESAVANDAEVFSQASANRLFPKLRFSLNKTSDFINKHDNYQAHLSFLSESVCCEHGACSSKRTKPFFLLEWRYLQRYCRSKACG